MSNLGLNIYSDTEIVLSEPKINTIKNLDNLSDDSSEELNQIFKEQEGKDSELSLDLIKDDYQSESSELDSISLDFNDDNDTYFLSMKKLKTLKFIEIYNIILKNHIIIFVDESKFYIGNNCFSKFLIKKYYFLNNIFPGCVFISYNFKNILIKSLSKLNDRITNENLINKKYKNKNDIIYNFICFDEGEILKDVIYKRMEIREKILFIPIEKYNLKITEYKIRGFCQIMEEMGAKNIEIKFINNNKSKSKFKIDVKNNIDNIVSNLGFNLRESNEKNENRVYNLNFSKLNTIILNENHIIKKIKNKEYILSENNYNSNLELQYVISSRCKHYIKKYATSFTLDSNVVIDKKLFAKLEKFKIGSNLSLDRSKLENTHYSILTNVIFFDINEMKDKINGSCVSFDYNGFNFLISSLTQENFKIKGIYKIIDFIEYYCHKSLKKVNNEEFIKIRNVLNMIKEKFTLKEYSDILLNYFSINSSWIDFEYFINLLLGKSVSYDKLGFLILYENNIEENKRIEKIIDFIYNSCIEKDKLCNSDSYQKKFWLIFNPNNKKLFYFLKKKLNEKYNLIKTFNLYNFSKLMYDIMNFNLISDIQTSDNSIIFEKYLDNFEIGFSYYEFYTNMINFIIKIVNIELNNYDNLTIDYKNLIHKSFNFESFIQNRINTFEKLKEYINYKIKKVLNFKIFFNEFIQKVNNEDQFYLNLKKLENFSNYKYISKKINIIFRTKKENKKIILDYFNDLSYTIKIITKFEEKVFYFFSRCFLYNDKINVNYIPLNYLGFEKLFLNIINGYKNYEINNMLIFGSRIIKRIANENYKNNLIKYNYLSNYSDIFIKLNDKKILERNSYYKYCSFIIDKINFEFLEMEELNIDVIKDIY